jgi:glycosyltransferase involved in cell wall biosynthesis
MKSLFTFTYNCISQGYPFIESIHNLLPLVDEVVIVDCGSTDGTRELLGSLSLNPNIRVHSDSWTMGKGGRNFSGTAARCRDLCKGDIIIFAEADEVWDENLVLSASAVMHLGYQNVGCMRWQATQNFQRCFWYPEREQVANRIFTRDSSIMRDIEAGDSLVQSKSSDFKIISPRHGYIVDCRNIFRDSYLLREQTSKKIWGETSRETIRFTPAHTGYKYEISMADFEKELQDERWTWDYTPFYLPRILRYHLGKTKYEVRENLVNIIKHWCPDGSNHSEDIIQPS